MRDKQADKSKEKNSQKEVLGDKPFFLRKDEYP